MLCLECLHPEQLSSLTLATLRNLVPQELAARPFPIFKDKPIHRSIIYPKKKVLSPQQVLQVIGSKSIDNKKESKAGMEKEMVKE